MSQTKKIGMKSDECKIANRRVYRRRNSITKYNLGTSLLLRRHSAPDATLEKDSRESSSTRSRSFSDVQLRSSCNSFIQSQGPRLHRLSERRNSMTKYNMGQAIAKPIPEKISSHKLEKIMGVHGDTSYCVNKFKQLAMIEEFRCDSSRTLSTCQSSIEPFEDSVNESNEK
mmetsp:Transcript_8011/g.10246  ORF Transcript_8011/g.10246 Transcript_8011/m.10246 type:complete len:171 (+) Transcript_8011:141-653(+)